MLLIDTDHIDRVTALKRYETESLLDVLLTIKRLLNQINLQKMAQVQCTLMAVMTHIVTFLSFNHIRQVVPMCIYGALGDARPLPPKIFFLAVLSKGAYQGCGSLC